MGLTITQQNMDKFNKMFFSRTFWTLVLMFAFGGLQALEGIVTPDLYILIQGLLTALATYFKLNPSQKY